MRNTFLGGEVGGGHRCVTEHSGFFSPSCNTLKIRNLHWHSVERLKNDILVSGAL